MTTTNEKPRKGYILNKLTGVKPEDVKRQLEQDAAAHAKNGLHLDRMWVNDDKSDEVFFLFRVEDLDAHKSLMNQLREQTLKENPEATFPEKIYLLEE